jgi:RNA polymerase sigma-70 factor, ECF subfamily
VRGADNVARFVLGIIRKRPDAEVVPVQAPDGLSFVIRTAGVVDTVLMLGVAAAGAEERITDVWMVRNPQKLTLWATAD